MKLKRFIFTALLAIAFLSFSNIANAGSQQTSGVTAQTIIDNARYYINETTSSFWSDAELLRWVNLGSRDIAARTRCLEQIQVVVLISGVTEYSLSSGASKYFGVSSAIYRDGTTYKGLVRGNVQSVGHTEDVGEPVYYYEWINNIGVYPTPGAAVSGNTVYVYTNVLPDAITLTGVIALPAIYEQLLNLYVVAQALYRARQFEEGNLYMTHYYHGINSFRQEYVKPIPGGLSEVIKK